jgi:hypothetical protein
MVIINDLRSNLKLLKFEDVDTKEEFDDILAWVNKMVLNMTGCVNILICLQIEHVLLATMLQPPSSILKPTRQSEFSQLSSLYSR